MAAKGLPRIPKFVFAPAGPIPVVRKHPIYDDDGDECFGLWDQEARIIYIDSTLKKDSAWLWLEHEKHHAWLDDARIKDITDDLHEAIAHALAAARVGEMWWQRKRTS